LGTFKNERVAGRVSFRQIWLAKDTGCLADGQGFCKAKMAEIQPFGGDECFFEAPI
jgi:hypothetical protein